MWSTPLQHPHPISLSFSHWQAVQGSWAQFPNKIKSREVLYGGVDGEEDQFFIYILHFHLDDNAPCLSPKALHSH